MTCPVCGRNFVSGKEIRDGKFKLLMTTNPFCFEARGDVLHVYIHQQ